MGKRLMGFCAARPVRKFCLLMGLLFAICVPLLGQSRFPADPDDWLASSDATGLGARNLYNVTSCEVPGDDPDQGDAATTFFSLVTGACPHRMPGIVAMRHSHRPWTRGRDSLKFLITLEAMDGSISPWYGPDRAKKSAKNTISALSRKQWVARIPKTPISLIFRIPRVRNRQVPPYKP